MSEDWFDIAWVNHNKAILHGQRADQTTVERVLTAAERDRIWDLNAKHERESNALLRELAGAA